VELIKKVCLNMSNIFWDIGILVGYWTYGAPGRLRFSDIMQNTSSAGQGQSFN
jgi:hypothetical protein